MVAADRRAGFRLRPSVRRREGGGQPGDGRGVRDGGIPRAREDAGGALAVSAQLGQAAGLCLAARRPEPGEGHGRPDREALPGRGDAAAAPVRALPGADRGGGGRVDRGRRDVQGRFRAPDAAGGLARARGPGRLRASGAGNAEGVFDAHEMVRRAAPLPPEGRENRAGPGRLARRDASCHHDAVVCGGPRPGRGTARRRGFNWQAGA